MASGSSSKMDMLAGSGCVVEGGSSMWSMAGIGTGSVSVAGLGVKISSVAEDLSCLLGHTGLG